MSIACSVLIKPSQILICLCGVMILLANVALWLTLHASDLPYTASIAVQAVIIAVSVFVFIRYKISLKSLQVHISNSGAIILKSIGKTQDSAASMRVYLDNGSTLWPVCLFLRLKDDDGVVHSVVVMPDSLDASNFLALSVAMRWIARHPNSADRQ